MLPALTTRASNVNGLPIVFKIISGTMQAAAGVADGSCGAEVEGEKRARREVKRRAAR